MSLTEARSSDVNREVELGLNLVQARDQLGASLRNPMLHEGEYEQRVCDYVNAFQQKFFDADGNAPFTSYSDIASTISAQMHAMTEESGTSFDIADRVRGYHQDEDAVVLSALGFSAMPRAVTLTLLDVIDDRLPKTTARKWELRAA